VCITSTSILASLRCTCFDIARQILCNSLVDIQGKPPIVHVGHYGQPTVTRTLNKGTGFQGVEVGVELLLLRVIPLSLCMHVINAHDTNEALLKGE
jgi:hypothetical protein